MESSSGKLRITARIPANHCLSIVHRSTPVVTATGCALKGYPNGDGRGWGTHFSLYFVLMKGEFDELLRWPFQQKVTLTLLDHSDAKKHREEIFLPDLLSNSFKKPDSDMNVATGCPQFVSLGQAADPN